MGSWSPFVVPETVRIPLGGMPGDQWIEVKKRLTMGERNRIAASFIGRQLQDGSRVPIDADAVGMAGILAYLVEWSFRDAAGRAVPVTMDALKNIDPDVYLAIDQAVESHVDAMQREIADSKKRAPGGPES